MNERSQPLQLQFREHHCLWKKNEFGQLGDGTIDNKTTPTDTGKDNDWAVVANSHRCMTLKHKMDFYFKSFRHFSKH